MDRAWTDNDQKPVIFACQHFTRDAVWIPELQRHANTATAILRLEMLAPDPRAAAEHMGRLIDRSPEAQSDGAWRVASGSTRGDFIYLSRDALAARYPGVALDGLADVPVSVSAGRLVVPASHANGLMLVLSAD
jgi:hypothetical protein